MIRTAPLLLILSLVGTPAFAGDGMMDIETRDELTRMLNMFSAMKEGRAVAIDSKENARRVMEDYMAATRAETSKTETTKPKQ
jgi:hypothetical protein